MSMSDEPRESGGPGAGAANPAGTETRSRAYYDEFSATYERHRHQGYHVLIDDLEVELAAQYAGRRVLEVGCGTGLILRRLAGAAPLAVGVDLSAGMLARARERGLNVLQATADRLPFADGAFDAVVSFKVLPHVRLIREAMAEMARVTRPGGYLVLELYNRTSLRGFIKRLKRPTRIGDTFSDADVFTRLDSFDDVVSYLPPGVRVERVRGVRVVTPAAALHRVPGLGRLLERAERAAADAPVLRRLGGFLVVVARKDGAARAEDS